MPEQPPITAAENDTTDPISQVAFWNSPTTRVWAEQHEPIDAMFAGLTARALDLAAPLPGEQVIDIGCGSGTTLLALAGRVGPGGHVLGVDVAGASVARARDRIRAAELAQAEVELADVATHTFPPRRFDLAFSRFGVMFFTNPIAAFANLRTALKPGGRLTLTAFRAAKENVWSTGPLGAVRDLLPPITPPGPEEPGQFAWADPERVNRILAGAGFRDITLTPHDPPMRLAGPGRAAEAAAFVMRVGPIARSLFDSPSVDREAVATRLAAFFQAHDGPDGIVFPGAIWIVQARTD